MAAQGGEPARKKAKLSDKWWDCPTCLRSTAACSAHTQGMLGGAAAAAALQKQIKTAKANLKKAQTEVDRLQDALQQAKGKKGAASSVPTLVVKHGGWMDDNGEGWEGGRLPLTLAVDEKALSKSRRKELCEALCGVRLQCLCTDKLLYASFDAPRFLLDLLPDRPANREMRPGAVAYDLAKREIKIFLRKSRTAGPKAKLLGMLPKEAVTKLDWKHTPNKSYFRACMYCHRSGYIELTCYRVFFKGDKKNGSRCSHDADDGESNSSDGGDDEGPDSDDEDDPVPEDSDDPDSSPEESEESDDPDSYPEDSDEHDHRSYYDSDDSDLYGEDYDSDCCIQ